MKNNKGFSLVELIIVIAIMAVLVGVLAPTYLQYVEKSKKSNDVSTVDSVINAVEIAAIDPEVMTDDTESLKITFSTSSMQIDDEDCAWAKAIRAAVGNDVKLKSTTWEGNVVIDASRVRATGSVAFEYADGSSEPFQKYATALTKVKNS